MSTRESTPVDEPGLLRVHAWIVLLVTALTLASALLVLNNPAVEHTATAEVEVLPKASASGPATPPNMGTERELATSGRVAAMADEELEVPIDEARAALSVSVVTDTDVLVMSYTATDAEAALRGVDAFTRAYVDYRNLTQSARAARIVTDPEVDPGSSGLLSGPVVMALSIVLGLCLGAAAAFLWDRASGRVRTRAELRDAGLPVIGMLGGREERHRGRTGRSVALQGVNQLAVRVVGLLRGRPGATVVVTATDASLPISDFASELARALNAIGERAVRIDAEMAGIRTTAEGPVVVVDTPPLLEEPRAALLAEDADVVLVVTQLGRSRRSDVREAVEMLQPLPGGPPRPDRVAAWVVCTQRLRPQRPPAVPDRTDGRHRGEGRPHLHDDLDAWEGRSTRG